MVWRLGDLKLGFGDWFSTKYISEIRKIGGLEIDGLKIDGLKNVMRFKCMAKKVLTYFMP